jgi:hypothetical protein
MTPHSFHILARAWILAAVTVIGLIGAMYIR